MLPLAHTLPDNTILLQYFTIRDYHKKYMHFTTLLHNITTLPKRRLHAAALSTCAEFQNKNKILKCQRLNTFAHKKKKGKF